MADDARKMQSKMILVTGAGNGIGRASSIALGRLGYKVGMIDRDSSALAGLVNEFDANGSQGLTVEADVRDSAGLKSAVSSIESALGPIDVLIPCAALGSISHAENLDVERLQAMFDVNVLGMARSIDAVVPGMFERKSGHIIGFASVAGLRGLPWMPGYCATKAAVANYLEALRPSFKIRGVRITTLYPGFVATGLTLEIPFKRPVKMLTPEAAASHVVKAVKSRQRDLVFPFSTKVGMAFLSGLPSPIFDFMMDRAGPRALNSEF